MNKNVAGVTRPDSQIIVFVRTKPGSVREIDDLSRRITPTEGVDLNDNHYL
jgi:hypothetical protein